MSRASQENGHHGRCGCLSQQAYKTDDVLYHVAEVSDLLPFFTFSYVRLPKQSLKSYTHTTGANKTGHLVRTQILLVKFLRKNALFFCNYSAEQ
jgi:hypothetical protein